MNTRITRTWKFYTVGVEGKTKCKVCGKTIKKRFTTDYREDTTPDLTSCKEAKEAWEKEEHVCLACTKKNLVTGGNDITGKYESKFAELEEINKQVKALRHKAFNIAKSLDEDLAGKMIRFNGDDYVIQYVSSDIMNGLPYTLRCGFVSKREPWNTTSGNYLYFTNSYNNGAYLYDGYIDQSKTPYQITDENFLNRKLQRNKWLKENM